MPVLFLIWVLNQQEMLEGQNHLYPHSSLLLISILHFVGTSSLHSQALATFAGTPGKNATKSNRFQANTSVAHHSSTSVGSTTNMPHHCTSVVPNTIGGRFLRQRRPKGRRTDTPLDSTPTNANPGNFFRQSQWEDPMESGEFILLGRYPHSGTETLTTSCGTATAVLRVGKRHQNRHPVFVYAPTYGNRDIHGNDEDDDNDDMSDSTGSSFQADIAVGIASPKGRHSKTFQRRPAIVIHPTSVLHGK